jgi:hypothetical protein
VIFLARWVEMIGGVAVPVDTASVLANRRHREALYVARGTAARVHDMAVDIGDVGCRECRVSKLFGNQCPLSQPPEVVLDTIDLQTTQTPQSDHFNVDYKRSQQVYRDPSYMHE